jgi:hypothetical protein
MKISKQLVMVVFACPLFAFTVIHDTPKRNVEMQLSFPFLKKKFTACKDSSLLASIVIINRTDTLVTIREDELLDLHFEVETSTSKFIVQRKEKATEQLMYKILFPGDSVVVKCLLISEACQPTVYTRRIPTAKHGLRSIRAVYQYPEEVDSWENVVLKENQSPVTAPGTNKQRNAVRREETDSTPTEVVRSILKQPLRSNLVTF